MRYSLFKELLKYRIHVNLDQTEPVPPPAVSKCPSAFIMAISGGAMEQGARTPLMAFDVSRRRGAMLRPFCGQGSRFLWRRLGRWSMSRRHQVRAPTLTQ